MSAIRASSQRRVQAVSFVFLIGALVVLTGGFLAWGINFIVADTLQMVRGPTADQYVVQIVFPTPTPRIATPVLGTDACRIGMICAIPTHSPDDCMDTNISGGSCVFTGYTGRNKDFTQGNPDILNPPGYPPHQ